MTLWTRKTQAKLVSPMICFILFIMDIMRIISMLWYVKFSNEVTLYGLSHSNICITSKKKHFKIDNYEMKLIWKNTQLSYFLLQQTFNMQNWNKNWHRITFCIKNVMTNYVFSWSSSQISLSLSVFSIDVLRLQWPQPNENTFKCIVSFSEIKS